MTNSQESQLARLKMDFVEQLDAKYRAGAKEHAGEYGGELLQIPLLKVIDHALEEVIDLWAYLQTIKQQVVEGRGE